MAGERPDVSTFTKAVGWDSQEQDDLMFARRLQFKTSYHHQNYDL